MSQPYLHQEYRHPLRPDSTLFRLSQMRRLIGAKTRVIPVSAPLAHQHHPRTRFDRADIIPGQASGCGSHHEEVLGNFQRGGSRLEVSSASRPLNDGNTNTPLSTLSIKSESTVPMMNYANKESDGEAENRSSNSASSSNSKSGASRKNTCNPVYEKQKRNVDETQSGEELCYHHR
jgi:hypothetical protein